jgi:hypothetical protein
MSTFPIYAGFSHFEVVKRANPDILIRIAKIHRDPDFLKTSPVYRQLAPNLEPKFKIPHHLFTAANQKSGQTVAIVVYIMDVAS